MKLKKRLVLLGTTVVALALVAAMSYAWFTSSLDPVAVNITAAKIKVEKLSDGSWKIGNDETLLGAALPGETVSYGDFVVKNTSNREAVAQIKFTKLEGKLKFDNSNLSIQGQKVTLEQLSAAITASATLSLEQKTKFAKLIDVDGGTVTVNKELFDFVYADFGYPTGNGPKTIASMVDNGTAVYYSIFHFWGVILNIYGQLNQQVYDVAAASGFVLAPTNDPSGISSAIYYLGLPIPGSGVGDTLTFSNLSYKIPAGLGGSVRDASDGLPFLDQFKKLNFNWETKYFNEQESTINIEISVKVVQGTVAAVTDVFGNENIQNTSNPIWSSNPFNTFLTNN